MGTFTATCILGGTSAQEVRLFADDLAITIRQQGVLYEDARTKAVTATDGFTGSRLWGVTATRYVPTGNDPFRDEDRAFLDAIRHGDAVAAVQLATTDARAHPPPDVRDPRRRPGARIGYRQLPARPDGAVSALRRRWRIGSGASGCSSPSAR